MRGEETKSVEAEVYPAASGLVWRGWTETLCRLNWAVARYPEISLLLGKGIREAMLSSTEFKYSRPAGAAGPISTKGSMSGPVLGWPSRT